jgi:hypothetical protein
MLRIAEFLSDYPRIRGEMMICRQNSIIWRVFAETSLPELGREGFVGLRRTWRNRLRGSTAVRRLIQMINGTVESTGNAAEIVGIVGAERIIIRIISSDRRAYISQAGMSGFTLRR